MLLDSRGGGGVSYDLRFGRDRVVEGIGYSGYSTDLLYIFVLLSKV